MKPALRVVAPGLLSTIQDLGRVGYQRLGITVSGALDPLCLRAANLLVGNAPGMGALEIAYQGPTLGVEADSVRVAFAGGKAPIDILDGENGAGRRVPSWQSVTLRKGGVIRIGALSGSAVGYFAVEGGFDIAPVLGSQSTLVRAGLGGLNGRPLRADDLLPLRCAAVEERAEVVLPVLDLSPPKRFRVVFGPQDDYFTEKGKKTLLGSTYTVSPASDRMGMRLAGPPLEHAKGYNIVSDGIAPGAIQVPGNGAPIILLADRQTTGGYPKIATVISADIPALGRLTPGAHVAFEAVDIPTAEAAHRRFRAEMDGFADRIEPVRSTPIIDEAKLLGSNLVSGMIDARHYQEDA